MAYSTGSRSVSATYQLRRKAIMIIIILLVPVFLSFLLYVVSTSAGASSPATVGYGLTAVCTSNGVSYLWTIASGSSGTKCVASSTDPALPSIVFNALNSFLILIVIIGAIWVGYGMVHDMIEAHE
jgi:hypothetical protein